MFKFLMWMFELEFCLGYKPGLAGLDLWKKNYSVIEAAREIRKRRTLPSAGEPMLPGLGER